MLCQHEMEKNILIAQTRSRSRSRSRSRFKKEFFGDKVKGVFVCQRVFDLV